MDKQEAVEKFSHNHGLTIERAEPLSEAVYWLENSKALVSEASRLHFTKLTDEPTWRLIQSMLDRVKAYVAGSIVAFSSGEYSSAEIISRVAVEGGVNVIYILQNEQLERLQAYFSSYIATERSQNKQWRRLLPNLTIREQIIYEYGILKKEAALDVEEKLLIDAFKQLGVNYNSSASWPNALERFKMIGKELDYRSFYAAMSSQVHNDAEDLLNKFMVHSSGNEELIKRLADETMEFSQVNVYTGLIYYLEAELKFVEHFGILEAVEELKTGIKNLQKLSNDLASRNLFRDNTYERL